MNCLRTRVIAARLILPAVGFSSRTSSPAILFSVDIIAIGQEFVNEIIEEEPIAVSFASNHF
jgi:hypothetical protein